MALILRAAPRNGPSQLKAGIEAMTPLDAKPDGEAAAAGPAPRRLRRSRTVPLYLFTVADLVSPYRRLSELSEGPDGWRYLLREGGRNLVADLRVAGRGLVLNQLLSGALADRFAVAWRFVAETFLADAELRLLKFPGARMEALWLAGESDLFVDLSFDRRPAYSGPDWLALAAHRGG
jgi:hypothetical protein